MTLLVIIAMVWLVVAHVHEEKLVRTALLASICALASVGTIAGGWRMMTIVILAAGFFFATVMVAEVKNAGSLAARAVALVNFGLAIPLSMPFKSHPILSVVLIGAFALVSITLAALPLLRIGKKEGKVMRATITIFVTCAFGIIVALIAILSTIGRATQLGLI